VSTTLIKSPLLSSVKPGALQELSGLSLEPGFQKLKKLIDAHVEEQTSLMIRNPHLTPDELRDLTVEIRLFQGVADLPARAKEICIERG